MSKRWNIAEAKAEFSHVVRAAGRVPQVIENRGTPVAVILGLADYERWRAHEDAVDGFASFLEFSAKVRASGGVALENPRRGNRDSASYPIRKRKRR